MIGRIQRIEIDLAKFRPCRNNLDGGKVQHMNQTHKEDTPDSPIEISKWMDGLKPAIRHSQQFRNRMEIRHVRPDMS